MVMETKTVMETKMVMEIKTVMETKMGMETKTQILKTRKTILEILILNLMAL